MVLSITELVQLLEQEYGDPDWWPAKSPFEVAVGAILTQRTSWSNVEKSIEAMRKEGILAPAAILGVERKRIEQLIRPSGFYRQKTDYLIEFASYVEREYGGEILSMLSKPPDELRTELLQVRGIGPETADSILLYALAIPSFVVDAYAVRVLTRLGIDAGDGYNSIKKSFEDALDNEVIALAKAHALLVIHCKNRCKRSPVCDGCPFHASCLLESKEQEQQVSHNGRQQKTC